MAEALAVALRGNIVAGDRVDLLAGPAGTDGVNGFELSVEDQLVNLALLCGRFTEADCAGDVGFRCFGTPLSRNGSGARARGRMRTTSEVERRELQHLAYR
jgi:hypothetical protein